MYGCRLVWGLFGSPSPEVSEGTAVKQGQRGMVEREALGRGGVEGTWGRVGGSRSARHDRDERGRGAAVSGGCTVTAVTPVV